MFVTSDPQKRRGKTDLVSLWSGSRCPGKAPWDSPSLNCNPLSLPNSRALENRCQSHMAARSPSRYVAEVRHVSNPKFAYSKDKTAHMARQIPMLRAEAKPGFGKDISDLPALGRPDLDNDMT